MNLVEIMMNEPCADIGGFLLSVPERMDKEEGTCLHQGRNVIRLLEWHGRKYAIKRFRYKSAFRQIAALLDRDKAKRSYENALALLRYGIPTPLPAGYIVRRSMSGLARDGYYISEYISMPPICEGLHEFDGFNVPLVTAFAQFAANMHESGFVHNDLNGTNVRYVTDGDNFRFCLIDLNRMRFYAETKHIPVNLCFDDLTRFCSRTPMFVHFVKEYIKAREWDESLLEQALRVKKMHDIRYERRKKITRMIKRLFSSFTCMMANAKHYCFHE